MSTSYNSASVKCPFYVKDKPNYIVCEGIVHGTKVHLWFSGEKKKTKYIQEHCYHICQRCPIADMHERVNMKRFERNQQK